MDTIWKSTPLPSDVLQKNKPGKRIQQLVDILRTELSKDEIRELAASYATMPTCGAVRRGQDAMLQAVVVILVDWGAEDDLVQLLSCQVPEKIYEYTDLEYYLVVQGKKFTDPILILDRAYFLATSREVRHDIAAAFRRAFSGLGISKALDDKYVLAAGQWYFEHKDNLVVRLEYASNAIGGGDYDDLPLFGIKGQEGPRGK